MKKYLFFVLFLTNLGQADPNQCYEFLSRIKYTMKLIRKLTKNRKENHVNIDCYEKSLQREVSDLLKSYDNFAFVEGCPEEVKKEVIPLLMELALLHAKPSSFLSLSKEY